MNKIIYFNLNGKKALEVILYLINKFGKPTIYQVIKILYFADVYHLNKYDRPIVGDRYVAMPYGPVASAAYDIMKLDPMAIDWASPDEDIPLERCERYIIAKRDADSKALSASDKEALDYAFTNYQHYDFQQFKDETHEHLAWLKARENSLVNNPPMDYLDMIDSKKTELKEYLIENASEMIL